jgi:hypothetical protein
MLTDYCTMSHAANHVVRACSAGGTPQRSGVGDSYRHYDDLDSDFQEEILRFTDEKKKKTMTVKGNNVCMCVGKKTWKLYGQGKVRFKKKFSVNPVQWFPI